MGKNKPLFAFIIIMLLYFMIRCFRDTFPSLPQFFRFYLTDLLFVPAMASIALVVIRFLKQDSTLLISSVLLLFQTTLISIYFEWYLPNFDRNSDWYTGDLLDVLMYFIGAFFFYLLQRTSFKSPTNKA
jgi:hypothetical protein